MRARVAQEDRQRALPIAADARRDPGGAPRRRSRPSAPTIRRRGEGAPVGEPSVARSAAKSKSATSRRDAREIVPGGAAASSASASAAFSTFQPKASQPISRGAEFDRRRREQRAGVVDDRKPRSGAARGATAGQTPSSVEKVDRAAEQRHGAPAPGRSGAPQATTNGRRGRNRSPPSSRRDPRRRRRRRTFRRRRLSDGPLPYPDMRAFKLSSRARPNAGGGGG